MSGDVTGEFNLSDEAQRRLAQEVTKQLRPFADALEANQSKLASVGKAIDEIKKQNASQIDILAAQDARMLSLDRWRCSLFGNGSGTPGFLEMARKEDDKRYEKIFTEISDLKQDKYRLQGQKELLEHQETLRLATEDHIDARRTRMWTKYHYAVSIAAILAGSWFWSLVHPLAKMLVDYIAKAISGQ